MFCFCTLALWGLCCPCVSQCILAGELAFKVGSGSSMGRVSQQRCEPGSGMDAWTFARVRSGRAAQLGGWRRHWSEDRRQMAAGCATALCIDGSLGASRAGPVVVFPESVCEGFFVKTHLQNYVSSTSSHLRDHLCTSTFSPISAHVHICASTSLLIFASAHLHLCSSSSSHIYISAHVHICTSTSLLIFTSSHHLCSSSHPLLNFLS